MQESTCIQIVKHLNSKQGQSRLEDNKLEVRNTEKNQETLVKEFAYLSKA